jgi:uncharacterized protein DUF262/uncharacterized protein DUF1524/RAMA domain-containing protein
VETQVLTPQKVFTQQQRLMVPLFQRSYVWDEKIQWEPLWKDLIRITEKVLGKPSDNHHPHFLGAVVLQQAATSIGTLQERTIIDGQQRLTTLQLLFDALHAALLENGAKVPALRLESLVSNSEAYCQKPEDRFKVWPTNKDRDAFNEVMGAKPPVDYGTLKFRGQKMVQAHRFFSEQARGWLLAEGVEKAARDLLQIVVIELAADENAQEIFETLNARGAQLTPADLIKNFIFQKLLDAGQDVEQAYERYWKEFETGFWETEINVGRLRQPRSSLFLNHWLVARLREEIIASTVFLRFKQYATDLHSSMSDLLAQVNRAAQVYRSFITGAQLPGNIDRLSLFAYRTGVMESEVVKPLILCLLDAEQSAIPKGQLVKAIEVVESWMVRRMLVRATTKNYNQVVAEIIKLLMEQGRGSAGDLIESFLAKQDSESRYWPDDTELRNEFSDLPAYRRIGRGRLRMVLEAIEDYQRGWRGDAEGLGGERVTRGKFAIEHVMPRKWETHWPLPKGPLAETERESLIHTFGNLTLLNGKLNAKQSNGPWLGPSGKKSGLKAHDVLFLNKQLLDEAGDDWTEPMIRSRSGQLATAIIEIWPVPPGHTVKVMGTGSRTGHKINLNDLISAGLLQPGMSLYSRFPKFADRVATLLPDGRIDFQGTAYDSPSEASKAVRNGKGTNGWRFFVVDPLSKRSLKDVRQEYFSTVAVDGDDEDEGDDEDDE